MSLLCRLLNPACCVPSPITRAIRFALPNCSTATPSIVLRKVQVVVFVPRAPEQVDAEFGSRGPHTDVWGFATTMLHLATGQLPYAGLTQVQMLTAMLKQRPPAVLDTLPAWLRQLFRQCLMFDMAQRPLVSQLLQVSSSNLVVVSHTCNEVGRE